MEKLIAFISEKNNGYGYGNNNSNGNSYNKGSGFGYVDDYGYACAVDDGYGYGYGSGKGNGCSSGHDRNSGFGYGYNQGNGSSRGDGCGYNYGSGIKLINGMPVYCIDAIYTAITTIHGNVAKGYIFDECYILKPCYIVKGGEYFAHGKTVREANAALQRKIIDNMPVDEKIALFLEHFEVDKKYKAQEFYDWHGRLTGSCEFGRDEFIKRHNISLDDGMTIDRFIELTLDAYGGNVIKRLKEELEARYGLQ